MHILYCSSGIDAVISLWSSLDLELGLPFYHYLYLRGLVSGSAEADWSLIW
jgi:hypothetical protein